MRSETAADLGQPSERAFLLFFCAFEPIGILARPMEVPALEQSVLSAANNPGIFLAISGHGQVGGQQKASAMAMSFRFQSSPNDWRSLNSRGPQFRSCKPEGAAIVRHPGTQRRPG